ncbi:MAG: transaldolase [Burkholderiaceae bacterium]|nr:transaldolase [Burkholderiaceae bacterium]
MNQLESLSQYTTIVTDTGDIDSIARLKPRDATTNPSLILKAARDPKYIDLVEKALKDSVDLKDATDRVLVNFGKEILTHIDGRVSTEVDAFLSFDTAKTIEKARRLISLYESSGISRDRVLIKIATTWEGIQACKVLEKEGIHCNMTLIFSLEQAIQSSLANATLISPFVGRIYDWHKRQAGLDWDEKFYYGDNDPGVHSVREIYEYLKAHESKTEIMGASFRNKGQILALCGCDLLTISPKLLDELASSSGTVKRKLNPEIETDPYDDFFLDEDEIESDNSESNFRFELNQDAMASEKLAEGIRLFVDDTVELFGLLTDISWSHADTDDQNKVIFR